MKKIISLMLVLIFVFTLSACGKKDTSSDTDTSTPTQSEAFTAPENYASVLLITINPQFKLYLDENNNVLAVEPVNNDAKTFSNEIDFENKSFETVIEIILEKANKKGFVKENVTINFEITEQKTETVSKDDILQKAVAAAEQKATELNITITAEAKETADNTGSETDTSTSTPSTDKPSSSVNKPTTSTTTPSCNKPSTSNNSTTSTACKHNVKYTFDNKANTWTYTGKCTICNEYVGKNVACKDENKDNKCDLCSAKMDFGTAYLNAGFTWFSYEEQLYDSNGKQYDELYRRTFPYILNYVYSFCIGEAKVIDESDNYFYTMYYYSATEIESIAKSHFNIDDSNIALLRTLMDYRNTTTPEQWSKDEYTESVLTPIYDSATNTYNIQEKAAGGYLAPDCLGYKKTGDNEYTVYFYDSVDGYTYVNCTYSDTVKISSIERKYYDTAPSDLIKLNIPSYSTEF